MNILNQLTDSLSTYFSGIIDFLPKLMVALTIVLLVYIIMRIIRSRLTRWIRKKSDDHLLVDFMDGCLQDAQFCPWFSLIIISAGILGSRHQSDRRFGSICFHHRFCLQRFRLKTFWQVS